jgi:anaerobic selenocysteine-containing dehydrogenase
LAVPAVIFAGTKTMILFEKGVYWSHNYENTAAIGSLGALIGSVGRPGSATFLHACHRGRSIDGEHENPCERKRLPPYTARP